MMRKKLSMTDVVCRKDDPDAELFRLELSWDTELYVLLTLLLCFVILAAYKLCRRFH